MIIFVEDTNISELRSLFNGETNSFDLDNNPNVIFNISSLYNMGLKVDLAPPPVHMEERQYDQMYAQWILGNNDKFINFFQMIYNYYLGFNVFILVGTDIYGARERMTESLMKLIQQRYSIIPRYIATFDDVPDYYEDDFIYVDGLFNLDNDKERYIYLTSSIEQLQEEMKANDERLV